MNTLEEPNKEILTLTHITKKDNETIQIIGDESLDIDEFSFEGLDPNLEEELHNTLKSYYNNKNPLPLFQREANKLELWDTENEKLIKTS